MDHSRRGSRMGGIPGFSRKMVGLVYFFLEETMIQRVCSRLAGPSTFSVFQEEVVSGCFLFTVLD